MTGRLRHGDIYDLAERQGGFFTARQAREAGLADNTHPYHVKAGNWIRERRGIYRLARFPLPSRPDLILWQLVGRTTVPVSRRGPSAMPPR